MSKRAEKLVALAKNLKTQEARTSNVLSNDGGRAGAQTPPVPIPKPPSATVSSVNPQKPEGSNQDIPKPPSVRVTSGEKVQQWLVSNLKDAHQASTSTVVRKLEFSKETDGMTSGAHKNASNTIKVSKRILSPEKQHGKKSKGERQVHDVIGGLRQILGELTDPHTAQSKQAENCNIVMEYQDDDLRPPEFYIEETEDNRSDILDQPASKKPRLQQHNTSSTKKVSGPVRRKDTALVTRNDKAPETRKSGPAVLPEKSPTRSPAVPRVTRKQIPSDNIAVCNPGRKEGAAMSMSSPGTNWRKVTPPGPRQLDKGSFGLDCQENNSRQSSFVFNDDDEPWPLDDSPSKNVSHVSSPEKGGEIADQEGDDIETPPTATSQKRKMLPKESHRKRSLNPSNWQRKVSQKAFNDGVEHLSSQGKLKEAREMGDPCRDGCKKCKGVLTHSEREALFHTFWNLPNINRKRDYISRHIKSKAPDTCSTSPECAKKTTRHYFFTISGKEILVCKTMFLSTLGVPDCWIETSLRKCKNGFGLSPDKRGKHLNRPKRATDETINSVKTHINLFPRVHSHYTRERSKREYLETELKSVERMYRLYQEWAKETNVTKPASASMYRKIFNTQFNLGFFLPKKDQCETCNKWKHATGQEERKEMVQDYSAHLQQKKLVKELKQKDVSSANESKCVACFDLQKVLICPKAETSLFFYKNKLNLFNFTVFDTRLSEGHCYIWTETDGHKGPNEIGTNLYRFIEKKASEGVQEFSFYSDGPTGQNKNRMIFSLHLWASAKFGVNITHRFLESGHSYSEADSMHARIEDEAKRVQEIFTPGEWIDLIKKAKQTGKKYLVSILKNEEIFDLHYLVDRQNWNGKSKTKIYWSQVREVSVACNKPNIISYRYNFTDECSEVQITMKAGDTPDMSTFNFPLAYTGRFPLPKKKKDDIEELIKKKAIPTKYHETFKSYLNIGED